MYSRNYNCGKSGIQNPNKYEGYSICHSHPKPSTATSADRPDIARCMTFFRSKAENEANNERKTEYLAAAAEDREILDMLQNADKHSKTTDSITEATGSSETDEPVIKKMRI